jgi:hypothetical protein
MITPSPSPGPSAPTGRRLLPWFVAAVAAVVAWGA